MGLVLECDGCEQKLDSEAAKKFGRIEPAYYCQDCSKRWEGYLESEKAVRVELLHDFAAFRGGAQMLLGLKRLPDG